MFNLKGSDMKKIVLVILMVLAISVGVADAGFFSAPGTQVQEEDGSPNVRALTLKVTNGTLTDNGDGTASIATGTSNWTDVGADGASLVGDADIGGDLNLGTSYQFLASGTDVEIQAAIDIAEAAGGGIVHLGSGDFDLAQSLTINSDKVVLRGSGWGTQVRPSVAGLDAIVIDGADNCVVENMFIRGRNTESSDLYDTRAGIVIINAAHTIIENVRINAGTIGVELNADGLFYNYNTMLVNCYITNQENYGVYFNTSGVGNGNRPYVNSSKFVNCRISTDSVSAADLIYSETNATNGGLINHHMFTNCYIETNQSGGTLVNVKDFNVSRFMNCS
jgi:hypothetical protein